uniref:WD repeat-containing protein on Y chromosome n=1 Tax=Timema californicum TaxID=61474 RepID=A0A7R9J6L4_TIMCA|nr:unnamed protein product [Timema californicum]
MKIGTYEAYVPNLSWQSQCILKSVCACVCHNIQINQTQGEFINWNDLVSHLLLEFQEKDTSVQAPELIQPISGFPRVFKSQHRHPIARISFQPALFPDRSFNYMDGKYLTVSHDGMIHYWSLDMERERTVYSAATELKVHPTWVTDLVCLPDVSIVCTSSIERDLRFYDTVAKQFQLRILITSLAYVVVCMHYYFSKNIDEESRLVLGDEGGNVIVLSFTTREKGPFYHKPGVDLTHIRYQQLVKGGLPSIKVFEFLNIHSDWVCQVSYYSSLHSFLSCAICPENSLYMRDDTGTKSQYTFRSSSGISCFNFSEESHLLVTGGPDCIVRVWNIFVSSKANCVFHGHHAAICHIVLQDAGQMIFSLSKDRCIKVWDLAQQSCIQTYNLLPLEICGRSKMVFFYNPLSRNLIIGSIKIAVLVFGQLIDETQTDGYTHTKAVTTALYNPLFKCLFECLTNLPCAIYVKIVTVGLDSYIIVWDPWNGRKIFLVKDAHTRMLYGEGKPVEITAATFDPANQLLLTGAGDGTLKIWNFNTGTCIRNMSITPNRWGMSVRHYIHVEVTSVIWIKSRILAVGWDRRVTEFADTGKVVQGKPWETRHTDEILCTAVRMFQALATSSYNGELVLWTLETGQAYRRYEVANPTRKLALGQVASRSRTRISRSNSSLRVTSQSSESSRDTDRSSRATRYQNTIPYHKIKKTVSPQKLSPAGKKKSRARRVSVIEMPILENVTKSLTIHAMVFLNTRPMVVNCGTLLVAVENGAVQVLPQPSRCCQVWSHHSGGGYLGEFFTIHTPGDYVVSLATDPDNEYLFTGRVHSSLERCHTAGYVKTWLMKSYMVPEEHQSKVVMPKYRLQFPFLWKDRVEGRAKRAVREQPLPILLSSYRAHLEAVTHIEYLTETRIVIRERTAFSSSSDHTVRLWTLGGRYVGTLGTFQPWINLQNDMEPQGPFRIPPDIKRVASSTTLKVNKQRGGNGWVTIPSTLLSLIPDCE